MTKKELRLLFEKETGTHWENSQCEPDIDYVEWLEKKIISSNIEVSKSCTCLPSERSWHDTIQKYCRKCQATIREENEQDWPLAENCDHHQHQHCDCIGLYCMEGTKK